MGSLTQISQISRIFSFGLLTDNFADETYSVGFRRFFG